MGCRRMRRRPRATAIAPANGATSTLTRSALGWTDRVSAPPFPVRMSVAMPILSQSRYVAPARRPQSTGRGGHRSYRDFAPALRSMEGGLTLSGGEPLLQAAFSYRLFAQEVDGPAHGARYFRPARLERRRRFPQKSISCCSTSIRGSRTYRKITSRDVAPTLRFAERLAAMGKPVWVRFVLVPGLSERRRTSKASPGLSRR